MSKIAVFEAFAAAFEAAVADDDWSRLVPFLSGDVTYHNVGGPDPRSEGRDAVIAFLKNDVTNTDRRFDSRRLVALTSPAVTVDRLSRRWRTTYTLADTPDLVLEGEARYRFAGDRIKAIEEELTPESLQAFADWMQRYGDRLQ